MAQTLNGVRVLSSVENTVLNVGRWRHAIGNYNFAADGGATAAYTIFQVTGDILIHVFGLCQVLMDSGGVAKIELGIAGNTAALIAQTTATDLDQYETWQDAAPEANPGNVVTAMGAYFVIANGADVILTVSAAALTAGDCDFHALWMPLSTDGNLVAV
jgi:hypothetical protein